MPCIKHVHRWLQYLSLMTLHQVLLEGIYIAFLTNADHNIIFMQQCISIDIRGCLIVMLQGDDIQLVPASHLRLHYRLTLQLGGQLKLRNA